MSYARNMLITDIFRLSTRMFRSNRSRTILTIMGISVGIGAILFLVSLGYGLQRLILGQITTSDSLLSLDVNASDLSSLALNSKTVESIKQISGVERISPLVSIPAQMSLSNISSEIVANFAHSDFFRLEGTVVKKGKFYSESEEDKNKIIVSSSVLRLFDLNEDNYKGKNINFALLLPNKSEGSDNQNRNNIDVSGNFQIVGIIEEDNSNYVYLPFSVIDGLGIDDYSKIKVKVNHEDDLDSVRNYIIEQGYSVSALSDIIEQANQVFKAAQITLALFGIVALFVSAIGMFNTMTIALLERTQEIGIMKALGATSLDIWNMFLGEATIIGFLGGVGGIVIGFLGGEMFNYGVNLLAGVFGGERVDLFWTPFWFVFFVIVFSVFVGVATGFYPARRAAKINCLEALRYK